MQYPTTPPNAQTQAQQMRVHLPHSQLHVQQYLQQQQYIQRRRQHQQQQQTSESSQTSYNQYSQALTNDSVFLLHRSPFFETVSRHCVMPIHQRQVIQFQFNLPQNFVRDIFQTLAKNTNIAPKELHIRLFDLNVKMHEAWDKRYWELLINSRVVNIDELLKKKPMTPEAAAAKIKKKNKGFYYVEPLNISMYAKAIMKFQIVCKKNDFMGAAAIEIENVVSIDTISDRICRRSELAHNARLLHSQQVLSKDDSTEEPMKHECKICKKTENLSRCSRCKSIWYCTREHQAQDWSTHHHICLPFLKLKYLVLPMDNSNNDNNTDIVCSETRISLKDPLSLCRIAIPVRGVNCLHPQCMDLKTFLHFSKNCKIWQCPTCMKGLQSKQLMIDYNMKNILQATDENIDVVRLFPNQSYKIITLAELEAEEEQRQTSLIGKKRKLAEEEEDGLSVKRKKDQLNNGRQRSISNSNDRKSKENSVNSAVGGNTISTAILLD